MLPEVKNSLFGMGSCQLKKLKGEGGNTQQRGEPTDRTDSIQKCYCQFVVCTTMYVHFASSDNHHRTNTLINNAKLTYQEEVSQYSLLDLLVLL